MPALDISGYFGLIILLASFGFKRYIEEDIYYVANMMGSVLMIYYSYHSGVMPFFYLNIVWFSISVYEISKIFIKTMKKRLK